MDKVPRVSASTGPEWDSVQIKTSMDRDGLVPIMKVVWRLQADGKSCSYKKFLFSWTFSLDVVVEPKHAYSMEVFHLPEPQMGHYRISNRASVPGCEDQRIKQAQLCQENGSLWDPKITAELFEGKDLILVRFNSTEYSEKYRVFTQCGSLNPSQWVFKGNRTLLNVTLECDLSQACLALPVQQIQPFFLRCRNNCETAKMSLSCCQSELRICLQVLLCGFVCISGPPITPTSADKEQPEVFQVQKRKRVLIIYSLDHLLYKNIVLKFSAFLAAKCGTDVVLDLLDSTRLGVLGSIQWLEWHKEQIESSSDKILILCSRGVRAKWRAMCGGKQVFLREDALSPMGDTLTPSLTLLVPSFIRSASFEKYIVAYFDDVCSDEDIPLPFKITVRYKLMKQFEEVFFRILNTEKREPGRVKQIDGLSEDKYHECPSGRALRDAIEAFREYQLEHPHWFQEELLERSELEEEAATEEYDEQQKMTIADHLTYCVLNSVQMISDKEIRGVVTVNKTNFQPVETRQMYSTVEFYPCTVESNQLL
uniref:SEFIR domain-containing protein n=1 Tax=Fundulus heteroclitus TaxID=8078 RepID=A0A3Q2P0K9_FUNHE